MGFFRRGVPSESCEVIFRLRNVALPYCGMVLDCGD